MKSRRSIRKFLPDAVPDADIESIIEAAAWAPSGSNQQNWEFIVVRSPEVKERLVEAVKQTIATMADNIVSARAKTEFTGYSAYYTFFADAPVVIAVVQKPYESLARRIIIRYNLAVAAVSTAAVQGPAAAIQNMLLMAQARGLGTCWMTGPLIAQSLLEKELGVASPDELIALVPVGRPAVTPVPPQRKKIQENMRWM